MRIMLGRPTRNITIMKELNIENQWIWRQDAGVKQWGEDMVHVGYVFSTSPLGVFGGGCPLE